MAQYVVHQIGFYYTDECFTVAKENGTVMGITRSLEEARAIKKQQDLASLKNVAGIPCEEFYFDNDEQSAIPPSARLTAGKVVG